MNPKTAWRLLSVCVCSLCLLAANASAQSLSALTVSDSVDAALARSSFDQNTLKSLQSASPWLASMPRLSLSYLASQEDMGTDETEISLQLPLKSRWARQQREALEQISGQLEQATLLKARWFYSGLIREALWSHRLAGARLESVQEKLRLLQQLEQRQRRLVQARASSDLPLLLVQQEGLQLAIEELELEQQLARWQGRFKELTGLHQLPEQFSEAAADTLSIQDHPLLRALDLQFRQQSSLLAADSKRAEPWNVALSAKRLENSALDEDQVGISVELPLNFMGKESQEFRSTQQQQRLNYWQSRDELLAELRNRWQVLNTQNKLLHDKQPLLNSAAELAGKLAKRADELSSASEMSKEFALRRRLDAADAQAAAKLNRLMIEENQALLNQATGRSL